MYEFDKNVATRMQAHVKHLLANVSKMTKQCAEQCTKVVELKMDNLWWKKSSLKT